MDNTSGSTSKQLDNKAINIIYKAVGEMNHAKKTTTTQIIKRAFVNTDVYVPMDDDKFWNSLHLHCPNLIALPDNTYALKCFVPAIDLYYQYQYTFNHTVNAKARTSSLHCMQMLEKTTIEIRKQSLSAKEMNAIEEEQQPMIMHVITIIKRRAERIHAIHDFTPSLILNDDYLLQHQQVANEIPNKGLRFLIIEKILQVLVQQNIIFSGEYQLSEIEGIRRYYFDSLLLQDNVLLKKIKTSFHWHNNNPIFQKIVTRITAKPTEEKYNVYLTKIKEIQGKVIELNKILFNEKVPIHPDNITLFIDNFFKLRQEFNDLFGSFKKNEHNFVDKATIKPAIFQTEDKFIWMRRQIFEECVIFANHVNQYILKADFLNITEEHPIIQVAYRNVQLFTKHNDKLKAIQKIWNIFLKAFSTHLGRYNINFFKAIKEVQDGKNKKTNASFAYKDFLLFEDTVSKVYCLARENSKTLNIPSLNREVKFPNGWQSEIEYLHILLKAGKAYQNASVIFARLL